MTFFRVHIIRIFLMCMLFTLFTVKRKFYLGQKMKITCMNFCDDLLQSSIGSKWISSFWLLSMKYHIKLLPITSLVNSITAVQNQGLISRRSSKIASCYIKHWYCVWADSARLSCVIAWDWGMFGILASVDKYYLKIVLWKRYVHLRFHIIWYLFKLAHVSR